MSGSGGDIGGGGGESAPDCESLEFETQLSSPKEGIVEKISVGDLLQLEIIAKGNSVTVYALYMEQVAGGIASPKLSRLRECMTNGISYGAEVLRKEDGQVRIRVRANQ